MTPPPLHHRLEHRDAATQTGRDAAEEYRYLRDGCGVYELRDRVKFLVTGKDRTRWLNGMISNNIRDLAPNRGTYNFLLTPQGRIQGDLYAYNRGESVLLDVERKQAARVLELLQKHIIMDKVELQDRSSDLAALAAQGPAAEATLRSAGFAVPQLEPLQIQDTRWLEADLALARMPREVAEGFEIWGKPADLNRVRDALLAAGAAAVGHQAWEMYRIERGIPRYGVDIGERDLPQETGQDRALNFSKGCYVGQEIVERIRSRGAVHRVFAGFAFESGPPAVGSKITVDGKDAGEITSTAKLPGDEDAPLIGLGYIRREYSKPETVIAVDGIAGRVAKPPFVYIKANT